MADVECLSWSRASDGEDSIEYLRARGVEVETREDREAAKLPKPPLPGGVEFTYVKVPAELTEPVTEHTAMQTEGDCLLTQVLAPRFADDGSFDQDTVTRETAQRMKGMLVGGAAPDGGVKAPDASTIQAMAASGSVERYPLVPTGAESGERVALYIDEVGALRKRPRNARAEALADSAGLSGLSIHGDAYVGRFAEGPGPERNVSFSAPELVPSAPWVGAARAAHTKLAAQQGHGATEHLAGGEDVEGGFSWSQTEEDVEVRVAGGPEGTGAAKRVQVRYGGGSSLSVHLDGAELLLLPKLFDRVTPDDCS